MVRRAAARLVLTASLGGVLIGCGRGTPAEPRARLNILLVTIDTFRADRIGVGVAPAIDRLSASGLRFTAARTAVPLTLPSHATIHTGPPPPPPRRTFIPACPRRSTASARMAPGHSAIRTERLHAC